MERRFSYGKEGRKVDKRKQKSRRLPSPPSYLTASQEIEWYLSRDKNIRKLGETRIVFQNIYPLTVKPHKNFTRAFISDGLLWSTPNMRCCWNVRLFCINRPLEAAAAVVWGAEHLSGPSSPPKQLCWKHNGQLYHNIYRKTRISDVSSRGDFPGRKGRFLDQQEKKLCRQHAYQYPDSGFQSQSQAKWHSFIVIQYQPLYSEHQLVFRISSLWKISLWTRSFWRKRERRIESEIALLDRGMASSCVKFL